MTADEFRVALARLNIPQTRFAEMVGYRAETVSRWKNGFATVPQSVALAIELLEYKAAVVAAERANGQVKS